jgi:hypothetical protein
MKLICPSCRSNIPDHLLRATPAHPRGEVSCPSCAAVSALPTLRYWPAIVGSGVAIAALLFRDSLGTSYLVKLAVLLASTAAILSIVFWSHEAGKLAPCADAA